ncbi:hypothetical protein [Amnibacterium kyonggiense]
MTREPGPPRREGRYGDHHGGRWSSPWVIRLVAIVAGLILVVALAYAAAHGFLFSLPKR